MLEAERAANGSCRNCHKPIARAASEAFTRWRNLSGTSSIDWVS